MCLYIKRRVITALFSVFHSDYMLREALKKLLSGRYVVRPPQSTKEALVVVACCAIVVQTLTVKVRNAQRTRPSSIDRRTTTWL